MPKLPPSSSVYLIHSTMRIPHSSLFPILLLLILPFISSPNSKSLRFAEAGKRRIHVTDDLDDVVDDEEDESWKNWGKKSMPNMEFDPPPADLSDMKLEDVQAHMMKQHFGPVFGFVKLQFGVKRTPDMVAEIAMKWTKVLRTGAVEVKFMGVDPSTIMFTMQKGQDTAELKEFVLSQPEAYEIKIGDQAFRRPGDPSLEEVLETIHNEKEKDKADSYSPTEEDEHLKEEL